MKAKPEIRELAVFSGNADWDGKWAKSDVERDMAELGVEGDWVEYALERNFEDCPEMTRPFIDAFACGMLRNATFRLCGHLVSIDAR